MIMKETFVFMHTIGKITEENLQFLTIQKICVKTGTQRDLSHHIKMGAKMNIDALIVMVGRNKSFILIISK